MILHAKGKMLFSKNEEMELKFLKTLWFSGAKKVIFNKPNRNMPISFSVWSVKKNNDENEFIGVIQGSSAMLLYNIVLNQINEGIDVFEFEDIFNSIDEAKGKTAYEILKSKEEDGATMLEIERTTSNKPVVYVCYNNGSAWELEPWETGIVYERLKDLFGKGWNMISIDKVLQNLQ